MDLSPSPGQGLSGPRHHAFPHHSGVGASRELWRLRNLEKGVRPCPEEIWGCNKDAAGHVIRTGDKKKKKGTESEDKKSSLSGARDVLRALVQSFPAAQAKRESGNLPKF